MGYRNCRMRLQTKARHSSNGISRAIRKVDRDQHMSIGARGNAIGHQDRPFGRTNRSLGRRTDKDVPKHLAPMRTYYEKIAVNLLRGFSDPLEGISENYAVVAIDAINLAQRSSLLA